MYTCCEPKSEAPVLLSRIRKKFPDTTTLRARSHLKTKQFFTSAPSLRRINSLQRKSAGIKQVEIFNICEFYCSMLKVILLWMTDYTTLVLGRCLALKVS